MTEIIDRPSPRRDEKEPVPDVEIVIPVYNEARVLADSVQRLVGYLEGAFPYSVRVTIADNASTDSTWTIAQRLEQTLPGVRAVHLEQKGRGRALHSVWSDSEATVLTYMDVDLSTDLSALLPLVAPILSGHSDIAIGTRLATAARVHRGARRETISRCYNLLLRATLATRFSDAQCGFKAIRNDAARELLPLVEDTGWFFDTELLVLAERAGMRIHEIPVDWIDDPDSSVDVITTAFDDVRGVLRLARAIATGALPLRASAQSSGSGRRNLSSQLLRFIAVGAVSTAVYVLLFLLLSARLGPLGANALALLATAVANTAANRRHTFGVRGPEGRLRHHVQGLVAFGIGLALTSAALMLLHVADPDPSRGVELAALVAANACGTLVRFVVFRSWIFQDPVDREPPLLPGRLTPPTGSHPTARSTP